jgi:hypothetical protein
MKLALFSVLILSSLARGADCRPGKGETLPPATLKQLLDTPGYRSSDEMFLRTMGDATARAFTNSPYAKNVSERHLTQILLLIRLSFDDLSAVAGCEDRRTTESLKLVQSLDKLPYANHSEIHNDLYMLRHIETWKPFPSGASETIDWKYTRWINAILRSTLWIKPGMKRSDLLTVFTTEGGMYSAGQRTYVHKLCPYIKVTVTFAAKPGDTATDDPSHVIVSISKPFLEYSVMD